MIQGDFNNQAMEEKIANNLKAGFSIQEIYIELCKELRSNIQALNIKHLRNVELSDQIEYIENNYLTKQEV